MSVLINPCVWPVWLRRNPSVHFIASAEPGLPHAPVTGKVSLKT